MRCAELVVFGLDGKLPVPRPCSRNAKEGSVYCGPHQWSRKKKIIVEVKDGAFCVWCAGPARAYSFDGVTIGLCKRCGDGLAKAIREGR